MENVDKKGRESLIFHQKKRHSITLFHEKFPPFGSHSDQGLPLCDVALWLTFLKCFPQCPPCQIAHQLAFECLAEGPAGQMAFVDETVGEMVGIVAE